MKFRIVGINPINYSLDIPDDFVYSKDTDIVSAENRTTVDANGMENTLKITVYFTLYFAKRNDPNKKTKLFHVSVQNDYVISDLKDYIIIEGDDEKLQSELLNYFDALSINHVRGIQSVYTKNTPIARFLIPPKTKKNDKSNEQLQNNETSSPA